MKTKIFKFLDSINVFLIYFSTITSLITLIAYGLSYSNDFSMLVKCVWSWLFNLSIFLLSGSVGYRSMPKFLSKSIKVTRLLFVILCYMIAIIFFILSILSFVQIFLNI